MRYAAAVGVWVVLGIVGGVGCATTDPSTRVKQAEAEREASITAATERVIELNADQQKEVAELDKKQGREAIRLQQQVTTEMARKDAAIARAQVALLEARQKSDAETQGRLSKMEMVLDGARERLLTLRGEQQVALAEEVARLEGLLDEARVAAEGTAAADDQSWLQASEESDQILSRAEVQAAALRAAP